MMKDYRVAVVGTGAVGQAMLQVLEQRHFPVRELRLLATSRSAGKRIAFNNELLTVEETNDESFAGMDVALFAGGGASKQFARAAVERGAVVIDNSSAFRLDPEVPLVVPEVNPDAVNDHHGIIANPNCSTIQMVVALKPIHDAAVIKRIVVSTYQAASGAGSEAVDELYAQNRAVLEGSQPPVAVFPHQLAFNVVPHIDIFLEDGSSREEFKMVKETCKIMGDDRIRVSATAVRVPVVTGHSEAVNIETQKKLSAQETRELLSRAPGVVVVDNPAAAAYPMALDCVGLDDVFVGRIREDNTVPNGLNIWIVSDNLRKGAATNAVQIAELLIEKGII